MALQLLRIKDLKNERQESNCSFKGVITQKGELKQSYTKKYYRKFTVKDGNSENDSVTVLVYKEEVMDAAIGDAYIFINLIYKGTYLVMTARSEGVKTTMPPSMTVESCSSSGTALKGRIIQVSPKRKTRGDSLQYMRLKDRKGEVSEVAVWGHNIPNEGMVTLTNLKSSKMTDYGTSRRTLVMVHEEESTEEIQVIPEEVIVSQHFPGKKKGQLAAVNNVISYVACVRCKSKQTDERCNKCGSKEEGERNFVCKLLFEEEGQLINRTMFHDDVIKVIEQEERLDEHEVENSFYHLIGQFMSYYVTGETITGVQRENDRC